MSDHFDSELFKQLCDKASAEKDSAKLLELTQRMKEMLEEKFDLKKDLSSKKKSA